MDARTTRLQRAAAARPGVIGLAGGLPAGDLLPRAPLAEALAEVAAWREDALQYGWPEGIEQLRTWIANRLAARGAVVEPGRIIITAGAQQALALAGAAFRGKTIAVGDVTYPAALDAFEAVGAGIAAEGGDARYEIAGVSNPRGLDTPDRDALLASGLPLIVDEAYCELRFDGRLPRPLIADAPDRTWHIGTVSKTLCPGLRVGWLVPPASAHASVLERKQAYDLQTSSISQAALARMLSRLDYEAALDRARAFYAERAERLVRALRTHLPSARFVPPEGGFSIWVETERTGDDVPLLARAIERGVAFDPGSMFRPVNRPDDPISFRLSFSSVDADAIDEGVRRLAGIL